MVDALRSHHTADFEFGYSSPGSRDFGWGTGFSLPPPSPFLIADTGSDISPYPEDDVSGVVHAPIRELEARMSDDSTRPITLVKARESTRERHPWLRNFSVFDAFYPAGIKPKVLRAFDGDGALIATFHSHRGLFY
jgi:hypothetical protein